MLSDRLAQVAKSVLKRRAMGVALCVVFLIGASPVCGQSGLRIAKEQAGARVSAGNQLVMQYQGVENPMKPYVKLWATPGGVNVLRDSPADHKHHHGLMFAVAVDGVNFWEERQGSSGCQKNRSLVADGVRQRDGRSCAVLTHQIEWIGPDSSKLMLQEQRILKVCRADDVAASLLIWQGRFRAPPGQPSVTLGGSRYFGLGMRFVRSMDIGGQFQNADGKTGVEGTNDTRSAWCAYRAVADGKPVTVAMFDYPDNPRHPATWFTMDSHFAYLAATLNLSKQPLVIHSGKPLVLRYAVALWDGHVEAGQIDQLYRRLTAWSSEEDEH